MDLSYRKAGKMDVIDFMARFDLERLGLSEFVRGQLLEGGADSKGMKTELYKLNVYGQCLQLLTSIPVSLSYDKRKGLFLQVT